jgi:hypothetical protein
MRRILYFAVGACAGLSQPALAGQHWAIDGLYSHDADGTHIARTALDFDVDHGDAEHYHGLSLEQTRFSALGTDRAERQGAYYRVADDFAQWKWNGRIGSDGHSLLGSAAIHNEMPLRQEYFVERAIVETPLGFRRGIYYTYAGAAYDLPLGDRDTLTTLVGLQDFSGRNRRLQFRGKLVHVLAPAQGLSAQLRLHYFHSSAPGEFDYYSPRWYAQVLPTLQVRRFHDGWRYAAAAGYGRQRDAASPWRPARLAEASVTSPEDGDGWFFQTAFTYTNTAVSDSYSYNYRQLTLSIGANF